MPGRFSGKHTASQLGGTSFGRAGPRVRQVPGPNQRLWLRKQRKVLEQGFFLNLNVLTKHLEFLLNAGSGAADLGCISNKLPCDADIASIQNTL